MLFVVPFSLATIMTTRYCMQNTLTLSLKHRVIKAAYWTVSGHLMRQLLRLATNLVMTRLLAPEMFGLMAMVNVLIAGLALFSDFGLHQNVVQSKRGDDQVFLDTVWVLQILRGALLCSLALLFSVGIYLAGNLHLLPAATVYADPTLPIVFAVMSLGVFVAGFESTKTATAARGLDQRNLITIDLASQIAGMVVMVLFAIFNQSVWALVIGGLFSGVVKVAMSHLWIPGNKNSFHIERESFREIFSFGKWIFLSSILGFLLANGDRLILGALVSPEILGVYSIAFLMINSAYWVMLNVVVRVAFPAISETVRNNPGNLHSIYYKFRLRFDLLVFPMAGFLYQSGDWIIKVLYDTRYFSAGPMLEILAISVLIVPYLLTEQCYLAQGKAKILFFSNVIRVVFLYCALPIGFFSAGLNGGLWAITASAVVFIPMSLFMQKSLGIFDAKRELLVFPLTALGVFIGFLVDTFLNFAL
ncbi:MAG: hypothetical protein B7Y41_14205 [Hydrogenophilales bacterium 28-61-23]|nr:MAG: hypothetical protein B7Y41_14205 [Hydrogenophilales bacterium 28-61-23]